MIKPRVHEKSIPCDREVMAILGLAHTRRGIVRMAIAAYLAAEAIRDDARARSAVSSLMVPARKYPFISGKPFQPLPVALPYVIAIPHPKDVAKTWRRLK